MARPRKDSAGDTRERILEEALWLFSERGFHATSMRDLGTAVRVRESALYHHFSSKDAILDELMKRYGPSRALAIATMDVDAIAQMGVKPFIRQMSQFLLQVWYEPQEIAFARLMLAEGTRAGFPEKSHPRHAILKAQEAVTRLFTELMDRKLIRRGDPEAYLLAYMGPMMLLRLQHQLLKPHPTPIEELRPRVAEHVENFWRVIAPTKK